jgi:hypothetical protein
VNNITTRAVTVLLFASAVVLALLLFYAGAAWRARVTTGASTPHINTTAQADLGRPVARRAHIEVGLCEAGRLSG